MDKLYINGGRKLNGVIKVDGAKNALLPIIAGCILVDGKVELKEVPRYTDVVAMCNILEHLGAKISWQENNLLIDATVIEKHDVTNDMASSIRSSIFVLGPLLARQKVAKVAYPGGCEIGLRPIDVHINSLKTLGSKIVEKNGYIYADGNNFKGKDIVLDLPSVGATENVVMAAVLTKGRTRVFNPAKEPEIVDLQNFLNACGAKIKGAGSNMIEIEGVKRLKGCTYKVIPDRIIAGTYLLMTAMCGGKVVIENFLPEHNHALIAKFNQSACNIELKNDKLIIKSEGRNKTFGEIETGVFPSFPTDLQAQAMALQCVSEGYCIVVENLFEARFKHVPELIKMGANIKFKSNVCIVNGREKLFGSEVNSPDLRGGIALVMAGLKAEGYTTVNGVQLIDRGYYKIEETLASLGGDIKRIKGREI